MPSMNAKVARFHELAAPHSRMSQFRSDPGLPSAPHRAHVLTLTTEEYTELTTALAVDENLPDSVDGFLDIMYVCRQGLLSCGLTPDEIDELEEEVHRANMTKVDPGDGLLGANDGKPYIDEAGKISKPPGFKPPDIEGLLLKFRRARG